MRFFWRFRKRYGMKKYYFNYEQFHQDFVRVFGQDPTGRFVSFGNVRVHVDPRGDCGFKGKVLCYKRVGQSLHFLYKHRKQSIPCDTASHRLRGPNG